MDHTTPATTKTFTAAELADAIRTVGDDYAKELDDFDKGALQALGQPRGTLGLEQ